MLKSKFYKIGYNYQSQLQSMSLEISEENLLRIQERIDKLKISQFKQQNLSAFKEVPTFASAALKCFLFSVLFLTPGIVIWTYTNEIRGINHKYDECGPIGSHCTMDLHIEDPIKAPIYAFYQLDNFY